jgi:hypothetical protein
MIVGDYNARKAHSVLSAFKGAPQGDQQGGTIVRRHLIE